MNKNILTKRGNHASQIKFLGCSMQNPSAEEVIKYAINTQIQDMACNYTYSGDTVKSNLISVAVSFLNESFITD